MGSPAEKGLREGVTTGSCAAAAALASAIRQIQGRTPPEVCIVTPQGRKLTLSIQELSYPACGVVKDAGDDPDATNGMTVIASVALSPDDGPVTYRAGEGVGTVTLPGLKVPPGEPAVNPVPRQMIEDALRSVIGPRSAVVTIAIPGGEERARRTFNPRLGIKGGLSILGTTGIVRPYNLDSVYESFTLELQTFLTPPLPLLGLTFGNTGEQSMRKAFRISGRCIMQTGNYIGYVLDEALRLGIKRILLCGHPGKLLKVAAGTFDTYNRTGDGRREALCTQAALAGAPAALIRQLYESASTESAMSLIRENSLDRIWNIMAEVTARRCRERMFHEMEVESAYIDNQGNLLGASARAPDLAEELRHAP